MGPTSKVGKGRGKGRTGQARNGNGWGNGGGRKGKDGGEACVNRLYTASGQVFVEIVAIE